MVKTVLKNGSDVPRRFSDDDAYQIVHVNHDGEYCSKQYWKKFKQAGDNDEKPKKKQNRKKKH